MTATGHRRGEIKEGEERGGRERVGGLTWLHSESGRESNIGGPVEHKRWRWSVKAGTELRSDGGSFPTQLSTSVTLSSTPPPLHHIYRPPPRSHPFDCSRPYHGSSSYTRTR